MSNAVFLDLPSNFSFRHTIYSHGWCELAPFEIDEENWRLRYVFTCALSGKPASATLSDEGNGRLRIELNGDKVDTAGLLRDVTHLLRLDDDLADFYRSIKKEKRLGWVASSNAGRLLRAPTVFEDLVKTVCTTNCSWSLTKKMVSNLVEALGQPAANGKKTFPTPEAMAAQSPEFYRDEMRAGYRSPYFGELAEAVAAGKLDPESWLHSDLPTPDLKKEIKKIKGVGDYAAEHMLRLVGRYDGLALDSWVRSQFYKKHNREAVCDDRTIEEFYAKFGEWKGLACWCDMTERWFK
jgi:3-methyladenine DNA glycosylase/8-oxoguanine DNA glycosylase